MVRHPTGKTGETAVDQLRPVTREAEGREERVTDAGPFVICTDCLIGIKHVHPGVLVGEKQTSGPVYKISLLPKDCTIVLSGRGDAISVPMGEKYWPTL